MSVQTVYHQLSIETIIHDLARLSGVTPEEIVGPSRKTRLVKARQLCMYFAWRHTDHTLASIGKAFNRDHSTVVHSVAVVERGLQATRPPRLTGPTDQGCGGPCKKSLECPFPACIFDGYRPKELVTIRNDVPAWRE